ncbi:hypothetical protein C9374_000202 [Naegleria lovaniensis]|uniref:Uncharacterized protein n=1 Tax=Naegleria lovaniensis TaxID=51637 RepID=A0AA88KNU4_NAELO|nr:uncharacterized protein C9374_000202 [Naegleria lovaniensis]KAG2388763.1 hypothetical protein C9374_000202 [Naegleria lovaniensis]
MNHQKPSPVSSFVMTKLNDKIESELCPTCVYLLDFALADLEAAVDAGTVFSCMSLCKVVAPYGPYVYAGCEVVCTAVGVNAFIAVLKKADLDPIYGCQLLNVCPVHDCTAKTCATFTNAGVIPQVSPMGGKVMAYARLNVFNESGPGQVVLKVTGPFSAPDITSRYYQADGFMPGAYEVKFEINTNDNDGTGLLWFKGKYNVQINACEGECGAHRPHSRLIAQANTFFNLTDPIY